MAAGHPMSPAEIERFTVWLIDCGGEVLPGTNPYEVLRTATKYGVNVIYRNKAGKITWPDEFTEPLAEFRAGRKINLCQSLRKRTRDQSIIDRIISRDGLECWFSGAPFQGRLDTQITLEHLCAISHGGPNHISNLVICTAEWNRRAGNLSIAEKVRIREQARGMR
jgi:hypothetical protein